MKKISIIMLCFLLLSCSISQKENNSSNQSGSILTGTLNNEKHQFVAEKEIKLILLKSNPNTFTGTMDFVDVMLESPEKTGTEIEKTKFVLSTLLSLGIPSIGENQYNALFLSKAYVNDIFPEDGNIIVDFGGTFQGTQSIKKYIKLQIEKNIAQYLERYEIRLNRSKKEWDCLFETTTECNVLLETQDINVSQTGADDVQSLTGTTDVVQ